MSSPSEKPFLDYYRANAISPVSQDLSDLRPHFERRESLYRALGIVPSLLEGRSVIEFGPGSGHNAIYTASLRPRRYVLVDGNSVGLAEARRLFDRFVPDARGCEMVESTIEDYDSAERFDVVLCEGTIPGQLDPGAFAARVARFVAPGGMFVLTTQDPASCLAELLRRVVAAHIVARDRPVRDQLEALRPFFAGHIATLPAMSRPLDDWILDNIVQPYFGELFPVSVAIDVFARDGLDIEGASPRFFTDWRWYKTLVDEKRSLGPVAKTAYFENLVNLMDYRSEGNARHDAATGERLLDEAIGFYRALLEAERQTGDYAPVKAALGRIQAAVRPVSPLTADSIAEALAVCEGGPGKPGASQATTASFRSFFGHGQQYVSFLKLASGGGSTVASKAGRSVSKR